MSPVGSDERRLFSLYEYDRAGRLFMQSTITALARAKHPLLREIEFRPFEREAVSAVPLAAGGRVKSKPIAAAIRVNMKWQEAAEGDLEHFLAALDEASLDQINQVMPQFYEQLAGMLEATGQASDAGGRPLSWDMLIEGYEKLDIDFDDEGKPKLPSVVMHPDMFEKLGPPTKEHLARIDEIVARKKKEFDARRRSRRLS